MVAGAALLSAGYVAAKFSSGEEEYREYYTQQIPLERSDSVGGGPMVRQAQGTGDVYVEDAPLGSNGMGSDQYNYQDNCDYPYPLTAERTLLTLTVP